MHFFEITVNSVKLTNSHQKLILSGLYFLEKIPLAQHKISDSTHVLVDYKNTASDLRKSSVKTPKNTPASGNGRIRKVAALCSVAAVGSLLFNWVSSDTRAAGSPPTSAQTAQASVHTFLKSSPNAVHTEAVLEQTIEVPETEFVFNQNNSLASGSIGNISDVPFIEVPEIDSLIDPAAVPVAAFINPAPLTAARPEHANDYTQEPSHISVSIKKGDSLFAVLAQQGIQQGEIASLAALPEVSKHLTKLLETTLLVTRAADNEFKATVDKQPLERTIQVADLKLDSSLFVDGAAAGLSESMIMELYSIFQWTVDFNREVRAGDIVTVLYESFKKNGKRIKDGNILAAEYRASDATHSAYRHVRNGQRTYFDADGQSLKKQFLRNPIKARITSRFNPKRKHPIRHTIRAHKGVDYGAPIGTPVSAAGDGRVVFMGVRGGYGNTVEVQHGDRYTTLYAHLSRFPKKLKNGSRISQGQVIGYVGKTGMATGPHLHYEFRVDGIHRDPQKVELPGSSPLEKGELIAFKEKIEPLRSQLASLRQTSDTIAMR